MSEVHDARKYECPVCLDVLTTPIYQCTNGHFLCQTCIANLTVCPICRERLPDRRIRNLEVETIISTETFSCPNRHLGCTATMKFAKLEDHQIDCLFSNMNFCSYLGLNLCKQNTPLTDFVIHLIGSHKFVGEFVPEGGTLEVCQSGAIPNDIKSGKVEWFPTFMVHGDNTFFLQTQVDSQGISWMISTLGSTEVANQFSTQLKLISYDASQDYSLTWEGQVCSIKSKFEGNPSIFNISYRQLSSFWKQDASSQRVSWKLEIRIGKKGEPLPSQTATMQIEVPARPVANLQNQEQGVHERVKCDGCGVTPLTGPRYKCIECNDYDLCHQCVDRNVHSHHLFLRALDADFTLRLERAFRSYQDEAGVGGPSYNQDIYEEDDWEDLDDSDDSIESEIVDSDSDN